MNEMGNLFLFILLAPIFGAIFMGLFGKVFSKYLGFIASLFPLAAVVGLINIFSKIHLPEAQIVEMSWVSELGIHLSFLLDGVSMFFGFVVVGMGFLVCIYSQAYLHEPLKETIKFYIYLLFFMFAMIGTVFSNNLMLLFMFWELTGVASFLLIGFYFDKEKSRKGALMALLVTGLTGLVLLIGVIVLGQLAGTYDFAELMLNKDLIQVSSPLFLLAFILIMIGAFGKSAQFPFHFWLPNAMAAPTPVSAYLHSAAMVKLGVFLVARMYPVFSDLPQWTPVLITIGFLTMFVGAVFSLLTDDIKGLLAYTTVSQLGFLIGFYGLGQVTGVEHDFVHILNHVFYKGCLFMIAGIAIHAFHTQNLREMGGLLKAAPLAGVACIFAVAGMGGIPGTTGFISKELMLHEILEYIHQTGGISWLLLLGIIISATCLIASGLRLIKSAFLGEIPAKAQAKFHKPSLLFQLPPFILSLGVIIYGLFPASLEHKLEHLMTYGLHKEKFSHLAIWHGLNTGVLISGCVIVAGFILYKIGQKLDWSFSSIPSIIRFDDHFNRGLVALDKVSVNVTKWVRTDKSFDYLPIIIGFIVVVLGKVLASFVTYESLNLNQYVLPGLLEVFIPTLIGIFAICVIVVDTWMGRLISLSVVGFLISFYFMMYKAPDLALTQLMIEAVSLVIILILLAQFPKSAENAELKPAMNNIRKYYNVIISIGIGVITTIIILVVTNTKFDESIGPYFIDKTNSLAGGSNAVNTILVDFRGFDTMGEITVLVISLLGVLGLLITSKKTKGQKA